MADEYGRLETDPVFLGLCRPAMLFGVSYLWMTLEMLIWLIYFVQSDGKFGVMIPGALATHLIGYLACTKEPRFMEILMIQARTCSKCINKNYHGNTHSYDVY